MNQPAVLLLFTGSLLGLTFPLGKLASVAGIHPLAWTWLIATGSAAGLYALMLLRRERLPVTREHLRYYTLLATMSLVIPNSLIFYVIPRLGSGFAGILFTLSPIFTLLIASLWRVRVPSPLGVMGILIGFVGAIMVASTRGEIGAPAEVGWVLLGLCIPLSLAFGNLYRTLGWPNGTQALALATGSNVAASLILLCLIALRTDLRTLGDLLDIPWVVTAQIIAATAMFTQFFRLQQLGGPTYLSQVGYVAAAVALLVGTVSLGEHYASMTWIGAGVIVAGIALSVLAQWREVRSQNP